MIQIGGAGDSRLNLAFGYDWEAASRALNKVSLRVAGTSNVGHAAPDTDFSANFVECAIHVDARLVDEEVAAQQLLCRLDDRRVLDERAQAIIEEVHAPAHVG